MPETHPAEDTSSAPAVRMLRSAALLCAPMLLSACGTTRSSTVVSEESCPAPRPAVANEQASGRTGSAVTAASPASGHRQAKSPASSGAPAQEKPHAAGTPSPKTADLKVSALKIAASAGEIILVEAGQGSRALVSMHEKTNSGSWRQIYSTPGVIGRAGLGKTRDGDGRTPRGQYRFTRALGTAPAPGMRTGSYTYHRIVSGDYWVGDPASPLFNRLADASASFDKKKSLRLSDRPAAFRYGLSLSYNTEKDPAKGSAVFMLCDDGRPATSGSIAVPEQYMLETLRHVTTTTVILIDTPARLRTY